MQIKKMSLIKTTSSLFPGDGTPPNFACREIDECLGNPCQNGAICKDRVNDYECQCRNGYRGKNCQIAMNYCEIQQTECLNGGTCRSISETASTRCECPPGFSGEFCEENRNECELDQPCQNGATCINFVSRKYLEFFHPF